VTLLRTLLRFYSYAFHAVFVFIAAAVAIVSLVSGPLTVNFYLLPGEGRALVYALIGLALVGALVLLMAVRGKTQTLFLAWSLLLLALTVRYFFFTPFAFTPDTGDYKVALWIILAAMAAVVGAWMKPAPSSR
jgi:hypothetical protein